MEKIKIRNTLLSMLLFFIVMAVVSQFSAVASAIEITDGSALIENANDLDGQVVVFEGEVLADITHQQDHFWINVLNQGTGIGIWITRQQRAQINQTGHYGMQGDTVRIVGQFNRACPEHGGDLDIHAETLTVIAQGTVLNSPLDRGRLTASLLLAAAGIVMTLLMARKMMAIRVKHTD